MKPHEETWMAEEGDIITSSGQCIFDEGMRSGSKAEHELRVMLAAQAPAMARLLLLIQWGGSCTSYGPNCPSCHQCRYEDEPKDTHAPDCELVAVLRAAGVVE